MEPVPDKSRRHINEPSKKIERILNNDNNFTEIRYLPEDVRKKDAPKVRYVKKLMDEAIKDRAQHTANWSRYWNFYESKQWPTKRINWRAYLVINYIFATIENIVAVMTDNRPKINLLPADKAQTDYVDVLQAVMDTIWRRRNVLFQIQNALRNAMIFGVGFLKVYWDTELDEGRGDINVSCPDPTTIYVDPGCTDFDDAEWVLWADFVSIDYIKRRYPEKSKFVRPGAFLTPNWRDERRQQAGSGNPLMDNTEFVSPGYDRLEVAGNTEYSTPPAKSANFKQADRVQLIEAWFRDDEKEAYEEKVKVIDPDTQEVRWEFREMERDKYPNGRLVTIAGDVVLQDIPSPYQHGKWPFVRIVDNAKPNQFYGGGEVALLEDLQKDLNKRRSQVLDYANMLGNGVWVIDHDSGVDPDTITNRPGLIITKMSGREVRREKAPEIPQYLIDLQERTIRDMQAITGIHDTLGGVVPRGIRTGAGMIEAQDIASTRLRLKVRNLEHALVQAGQLMIALIQQYYNPARVVRIIGKDGAVEFFELDGSRIRGDWDIIIGTGSTLPVSKSLRFEQAIRLFQMEAIDQVALLEAADWPGREEIIKRMTGQPPPNADGSIPQEPSRDPKGPSHSLGPVVSRAPSFDETPGFSQTFDQPPQGEGVV